MSREPLDGEVKERDLFTLPSPLELPASQPHIPPAVPVPRSRNFSPVRRMHDLGTALLLEYERGVPALVAPAALGIGALVYFKMTVEPGWTALTLWLCAAAAIAFAVRQKLVPGCIAMAGLLMVVGICAAKVETWRAGTRMLGGDVSTRITGRVVDIEHLSSKRVRLVLDVLETERPKLRYQPQRVRVSASSTPDGVEAGSVISGLVRLQPPPGPIRPGGYDFSFESYFEGLGASGFFLGAPKFAAHPSIAPAASRFHAALNNIRNAIAQRIRNTIDGPEGEIAAALIVGVRAGIPEKINEDLRRTGLAHILSISGLHMALVAAAVMVSMRLAMSLVPGFTAAHPAKKYAAGAALVVSAAYLLVSGGDVAAQRSFIMLAVMLTAVIFDRQALTMRNLAIAATLVLLVSPHEIVGPSFQMSFAATAALIGGYAVWLDYRRRRPSRAPHTQSSPLRWLMRWAWFAVAGIAATAIIAGLATSVYGIWHFQRVSPYTLVANLAVTPIVSVIVMPFGLLAMLAMPFGLDAPFLAVMGQGLAAMLAVSDYLAARSPVDAVGMIPASTVVLATIALAIVTVSTTRLRILALPPLVAGLALVPTRRLPDVLVAENALLVGVQGRNGELIVNRERPNGFTAENWQRALMTSRLIKPAVLDIAPSSQASPPAVTEPKAGDSPTAEHLTYQDAQDHLQSATAEAFRCKGPLCVVRGRFDALVAVAGDAWTAQQVCRSSSLVIVQQANARPTCGDGSTNIITARALALDGAAAVTFKNAAQAADNHTEYSIVQSMAEPFRPWHQHRKYSRAARGMEPYKQRPRTVRPAQTGQ